MASPGSAASRLTAAEIVRSLGPGLLWAGSAIGVSHLVQSTRAGAAAGLGLATVIVVALILKYPFFDFGPRYAAAARESLVEGYARIGRWALWLYLAITVVSGVVADAAIFLLTAFLLRAALGLALPTAFAAGALYASCAAVLAVGRYRLLDAATKAILVVLAVSTLAAAAFAAPHVDLGTLAVLPRMGDRSVVSFAFVLALVGWMPTAIDVSVWSSLWTLAKDRAAGMRTGVAAARAEFLIAYVGTGALALAFLILGAGVMHGSGLVFSDQGGAFSVQLIDLYADTLGPRTRPLVLAAVLTTMLSTCLTVVDGFPRAAERTCRVIARGVDAPAGTGGDADLDRGGGPVYWAWLLGFGASTTLVEAAFVGSLTAMADFATTVSFLTAPVLGYLNLRAIRGPKVPEGDRPGRAMVGLSWLGIVALGGFGVVYLAWRVSELSAFP